jgi:broad specificity phosphatase PhoE
MVGTTIILIRHGERTALPGNSDPPLNQAGRARAKLLVRVLGQANIAAIYTSEFIRTNEMAQPLATELGLSAVKITPATDLKTDILSNQVSKTVLVVGHSDTVPELIDLLGGDAGSPIEDQEFDNLFLTTILGANKLSVTRLKYGAPS